MVRTPEAEKLLQAIALSETGLAMMRQNLRRDHPDASDSEIDALFDAWLLDRPMDTPGRVVPWETV